VLLWGSVNEGRLKESEMFADTLDAGWFEYSKEERLAAIDLLATYDHCFIAQEEVHAITKPFGFLGQTYVAKSNAGPNNPKGLTLAEGLTELRGQDAAVVSEHICRELGVDYMSKFGRGSQLRECCEQLRAFLEGEPA
jgi:hypothetical protein